MNLAHAAAMLLTPGGRAHVALELRREELQVRLAAVTGIPDAATAGPLADEADRRQREHDLRATTRGTIGPRDPVYGLESVYRDVCAGTLGPDGTYQIGDIAYPDDHDTGCWKTTDGPDGYQVCNAPVPDDDPLGLCDTHLAELRDQETAR